VVATAVVAGAEATAVVARAVGTEVAAGKAAEVRAAGWVSEVRAGARAAGAVRTAVTGVVVRAMEVTEEAMAAAGTGTELGTEAASWAAGKAADSAMGMTAVAMAAGLEVAVMVVDSEAAARGAAMAVEAVVEATAEVAREAVCTSFEDDWPVSAAWATAVTDGSSACCGLVTVAGTTEAAVAAAAAATVVGATAERPFAVRIAACDARLLVDSGSATCMISTPVPYPRASCCSSFCCRCAVKERYSCDSSSVAAVASESRTVDAAPGSNPEDGELASSAAIVGKSASRLMSVPFA
jgi:hypothetical protein